MELKFVDLKPKWTPKPVLIVPLWNWNKQMITNNNDLKSFNRTFMELKSYYQAQMFKALAVLIVPLWNWNWVNPNESFKIGCFNRTFMELK